MQANWLLFFEREIEMCNLFIFCDGRRTFKKGKWLCNRQEFYFFGRKNIKCLFCNVVWRSEHVENLNLFWGCDSEKNCMCKGLIWANGRIWRNWFKKFQIYRNCINFENVCLKLIQFVPQNFLWNYPNSLKTKFIKQ